MNFKTLLTLALLAATPASALAGAKWLHVEVLDSEDEVRINLPIAAARLVLSVADQGGAVPTEFDIGDGDIRISDIKRIWKEVRKTPRMEIVEVKEKNATVRVRKTRKFVFVDVKEKGSKTSKKETVHIKFPVDAVDALLSGEGNSLNLADALAVLETKGPSSLVDIRDGSETVRIWID